MKYEGKAADGPLKGKALSAPVPTITIPIREDRPLGVVSFGAGDYVFKDGEWLWTGGEIPEYKAVFLP